MLSMAVFSAVVISNSWVTGQRDLRDLALARINGTNSRIIHMTLHHTAPTSSRSWGGDWRLGSYLKPVLSKLMTRFLLSVHVLSTPDLLRSATKESLLQLDPGCAEMIKYVQILTTILKPRWHELAEKLAKVSTQSEMTSGGSSLVIAIAPSDASQSLVELLDEATWVAIHVAWPRKLKTCHFLPNTSQFFHTSISSTIHQPVLLLCFLSSFSQRHATPWPLRCDTPI